MSKKSTMFISVIVIVVVIIGIVGYFVMNNKSPTILPTTDQTQINGDLVKPAPVETSILYTNTKYGFELTLPVSWKGYTIVEDKWAGQTLDTSKSVAMSGPKILIRHPLWTKEVPRQDIPIMIFTINEWSLIQSEKLSVGAAPIGPSLLGRNEGYAFALPARYNFAYQVGFEEVQKIIESKSLRAF